MYGPDRKSIFRAVGTAARTPGRERLAEAVEHQRGRLGQPLTEARGSLPREEALHLAHRRLRRIERGLLARRSSPMRSRAGRPWSSARTLRRGAAPAAPCARAPARGARTRRSPPRSDGRPDGRIPRSSPASPKKSTARRRLIGAGEKKCDATASALPINTKGAQCTGCGYRARICKDGLAQGARHVGRRGHAVVEGLHELRRALVRRPPTA